MKERIRVGVVGVGYMGANHARVYSMLRNAELVGIADPDPQARERIGALYGLTATDRSFVTVNYRTRDVSVYRNASVRTVAGLGERYRQEAVIEKPSVRTAEPLYLELEHFLACVRGAEPLVRPREAVAALDIALRIRDQATSVSKR